MAASTNSGSCSRIKSPDAAAPGLESNDRRVECTQQRHVSPTYCMLADQRTSLRPLPGRRDYCRPWWRKSRGGYRLSRAIRRRLAKFGTPCPRPASTWRHHTAFLTIAGYHMGEPILAHSATTSCAHDPICGPHHGRTVEFPPRWARLSTRSNIAVRAIAIASAVSDASIARRAEYAAWTA
jgi:hypothetical protein